jgi:hypothetical protein
MMSQYGDLVDAFADHFDAGETLYHYTSAEGLKGIIASSEIWLTNTAFVNDTTECRAFWSLRTDDILGNDRFPNKYVEEWWRRSGKESPFEENIYYVASFSKAKDSLVQWRAYGSFCIGLEASKLVRAGFLLCDCVYSASEIEEWVRAKSSIPQWHAGCLTDVEKDVAALNLLFTASVKFKNAYYKAEEEVRLVSTSNHDPSMQRLSESEPPIHFRDHHGYGLPVPYVKFFLPDGSHEGRGPDKAADETAMATRVRRLEKEKTQPRGLLPITEVRIGPMMRQKEARIACEILLQSAGYEHVKIEAPDIPYRGS